ncbi:hypothetical protein ACLB2K_055270 [Fragaria x ananassa]
MVRKAAGVRWGGGAPSPVPYGGEMRDVRTLRAVRTDIPDDFTMKMKAMKIRFEGLGSNLYPKLQTTTMATANWYTTSPPVRRRSQSRFGIRSARGGPSSGPNGGERRDVRTLRAIQTSSFERLR